MRMVLLCVALCAAGAASAAEKETRSSCDEDAMLVFDASGSMAGNEMLGIATTVTRIDKVRRALAKVLPSVTKSRRVGLISYGPGPYNQCNVQLNMTPRPSAADAIMQAVNALTPAGKTPLATAVQEAADVLDYKNKPGLIVVLTDGEETCGGRPCQLAKELHAAAEQLTIHVIGFRVRDFSWTGEQSVLDIMCLAEQSGGLYIGAQSEEELIEALEKTLGCPMLSQRPHDDGAPAFSRAPG
jgi:Ca-activated chloride channel family protein